MRKSREATAETRRQIVGAASMRLRERGLAETGLADVMRDAGLTHGGFYRHFSSKEQLVGEACDDMFTTVLDTLLAQTAGSPPDVRLRAFIETYLSPWHRDARSQGCGLAALAGELAREDAALRAKAAAGVKRMVDALAALMPDAAAAARHAHAQLCVSTMVGALALARAVEDDAGTADRILANARDSLIAAYVPAEKETAKKRSRPRGGAGGIR